MLDPTSWFGGHDDEDDDPVKKTLRYLGLESAGSAVAQGVSDVGAGISSGLGSAAETARSYLPQPSATPAPEDSSFAPPDNPLAAGLSAAGKAGVEAYQETGSPLSPWSAPAMAPARAAYIAERALPEIGGEIGAAAGRAVAGPDAAPYFTVPESVPVVGGQDVGAEQVGRFVGSGLTDPLTYVGAAGSAAAGAPARRVAAELARGLPGVGEAELLGRGAVGAVRGLGSGIRGAFAGNAGRVAAADARMAAEGSTLAPGTFGALPDAAPHVYSPEPPPGTQRRYHGTASEFDAADPARFEENGLYGPGYYTTSDPRVASSYAVNRDTSGPSSTRVSWSGLSDVLSTVAASDGPGKRLPQDTRDWLGALSQHVARPARTGYTSPSAYLDAVTPQMSKRTRDLIQRELDARAPHPTAGPNVRAIDIPSDVNLLDADAPLTQDVLDRVSGVVDQLARRRPDVAAEFHGELRGLADLMAQRARSSDPVSTPSDFLLQRLFGAADRVSVTIKDGSYGAKGLATEILERAGFDGIAHQGGRRVPLLDESGSPIEHDVSVIFPGSINKVRNAFSGTYGGAGAGILPDIGGRSTDRLGAVNRVLGQGIASSVSGGVGAQVNQEMNPDDPYAGIKGFAAGALVPPLAARGGMALARRAGAVGERTGGALATLGNVPAGAADDAARQARRARIAARGPLPELPEGAVPIRATPEAEVARLRLDLFPPDARADIQAAAEGVDYARGQRRGVLSDEAVRDLADDDARSVDRLIKGSKAGRAYNPEETVAVRNAVASQANRVRDLSVQIAEARTGGATPDLLVARRAAEATKLQALVQIAEGARAEAGRTLRQYATQARLIELDPNAAITRIRGKIADPDEYAKIVDEYTEIVNDGADPIQLAKLWAKVERGEITGSDLFGLYRRFNMLSGPRTFEVNALSGALNLGYEVASRAGMQALKGRGSEMAAEVAAPLKAGARAFQNLAETMWHGVSAEQAARGDVPRNLSARTDNPAARAALTALEVPDRLNAGVDQFFRTLTEEWAATSLAHKQARASGLTPRSPDWAETVATKLEGIREDVSKHPEVKAMADRVTFSEEPGGIVKGLEDLKRRSPNLVGFVAPFIRTPANIASRAVDISPLGPVRTAIEAATGLGRGRANLGTRVRDNVIGTAATTWAYTKARQGELTGAGPDDPEKQAELRATGWQPYSIKIGDQYWSYANFAPFSLALSAGAAAAEAQQYAKPGKEDVLSMLADGAARTGKVVTDMTVLAGLGAVIKAQQDPDRYGTQWLTTALTQLMPAGSFVNTVGQATDPLVRRSERTDVATQVGQNLRARVPALRETVPAAQDPLGRDIESEQTGFRALNPFRPTTERDEPVLRAFLDAGVDIGKPRQDLTISAYDDAGRVTESIAMPLTAAEQREWNRQRGEALSHMLEGASQDPSFASRPAAVKEKYLRDKLEAANAYATRTVRGQIGGEEIGRRVAPLRRAG